MRLFVAVDLNDLVRGAMRRVRDDVESALAGVNRPPRLTWVDPALAHVTVQFLGEVDERRVPDIRAALEAPLDLAPFEATWHSVGAFPSARAPRAIWIGQTDAAERFSALADAVAVRLEPFAGPRDPRPFQAHATIARVRDRVAGVDWKRILERISLPPMVSRVDEVALYRSTLSPRGPTYTALAHTRLARAS
jgi:2'-5' RNA ligase